MSSLEDVHCGILQINLRGGGGGEGDVGKEQLYFHFLNVSSLY